MLQQSSSFRAIGLKYKMSGLTVSKMWRRFVKQLEITSIVILLMVNRKSWKNQN